MGVAQGAYFLGHADVFVGGQPGDEERERGQGEQADHGHDEEGGAPPEVLAEGGGGGDADDVGDGQAEEHRGHGPRPPVLRDQAGGDDRADPEEGAVRQPGEEAAA